MLFRKRFGQIVFLLALLGALPAEPQQSSAPVRLSLRTRLTRPIEGTAVDRLALQLTVGQFVKMVVMQAGSDVVVTLRDPQERVLMVSDLPNGAFGAETVAAIAESSGEYIVEVKLGNPGSPKGSYQVTLEAAHDSTPADRELASAYQSLAQAELLRKKHTPQARRQSMDLLDRMRPVFAESGDRYSQAWTVTMAGSMLAESGDIRAALRCAEEAAELFHEAGDASGEAIGHNYIGGMLDLLGEPERALESYRQALALDRTDGNQLAEARVLNNIAKLDTDRGNWHAALDEYKEALSLARQTSDAQLQGALTHNIGGIHWRLGDFEEALAMCEQALVFRRAARDSRGEAETLQIIGSTYESWKQPAKALEYFQQALKVESALGDRRMEAQIRRHLGHAYAEMGNLQKAEESTRIAVDGARAAQDRRNTAFALIDLSRVLLLEGRPADALPPAEQALAELRAIGDRNSEASALESIARVESDRGNLAAARARMEEALRLTEESRTRTESEQFRASFFATRQDSFGFYIDVLMRLGDPSAAMEANERSRTRSLVEMLAESGAQIRQGVDPKLLEREREISNLLNARGARLLPLMGRDTPQATALKQEVRGLETEYQDVQSAIRKSSPHYAALTQPSPLTVKQIQEDLLDGDSLLLEYALGEKRSYLWVVRNNGLNVWELPARATIEAEVDRVDDLLTARSVNKRMETPAQRKQRIEQADAALPQAARRLSEMVIGPAASVLGRKRLVVAPDGALQRLPFAMLPIPGSAEPLVASHEIVVLPSASALSVLRSELAGRKPAPKMLAIFADPVFDQSDPRAGRTGAAMAQAAPLESSRILEHLAEPGQGASAAPKIPRLPFTLQEADQILQVARDPSNLKAVGFEANRAAATSGQLSQYRYVHFATHGYLDTQRPSLSALVLSQIDENNQPLDGFLRVNDIYNTRLSAELVVLSACQTGLGKEVRGEGLMGLTRAFLYAGAPRVMVSLWNVNDRATASLMTSLYRAMLRDGKRPPAALREAQLEVRKQKQWESPYYWAAFVQHGEWK